MIRKLRARRCQFCCNVVGKWAAFFGVLNCNDCVSRMQMGGAPRCMCDAVRCTHRHGPGVCERP